MSRLPDTSKFRHVFAAVPKAEKQYKDVKPSSTIWDCSNFIAANEKYFCFAWQTGGGGKLVVKKHGEYGKLAATPIGIEAHPAPVLDWSFNPFNPDLLVSASEDTFVKVWQIPEGGLTGNVGTDDAKQVLQGHGKKVGILTWHPSAEHVLLSAGLDHSIKLWDISQGERSSIDLHTDQIFSAQFNLDGSQIVTSSRDRKVRIIDVRSRSVAAEHEAHEGNKPQKSVWCKQKNKIVTVGYTKRQEREYALWDPRNMASTIYRTELDSASGVLMPLYDEDTNMLYLGGKGDGNIKYFEVWDKDPPIVFLGELSTTLPQKGLCMVPKLALDSHICEVARILKLDGNSISPLSFTLPRKEAATSFQADVYPDTFSNKPAMTADEYFGGKDAAPLMVSMEPSKRPGHTALSFTATRARVTTIDTNLEAQKKKVAALVAQLEIEEQTLKRMEADHANAIGA